MKLQVCWKWKDFETSKLLVLSQSYYGIWITWNAATEFPLPSVDIDIQATYPGVYSASTRPNRWRSWTPVLRKNVNVNHTLNTKMILLFISLDWKFNNTPLFLDFWEFLLSMISDKKKCIYIYMIDVREKWLESEFVDH